ncbi:MAG: choice-of-anchor tandem repeat NxxGxxAF-containing protein [Planctomycetota bacterium]
MTRRSTITLCSVVLASAGQSIGQAVDFRTVHVTGQTLTGTAATAASDYNYLKYNDAGEAAFWVDLFNFNSNFDTAYFTDAGGNGLVKAVQEGDAVPDRTDSATFSNLGDFQFNESGDVGFLSGYRNAGALNAGVHLFSSGASGVETILQEGDDAPVGTTFTSFSSGSKMNNAGDFLISGFYDRVSPVSFENDTGVVTTTSGTNTLIAQEGDVAPGLTGTFFGSLNTNNLTFNDSEDVAFGAALTGDDITGANDFAIYTNRNGPLTLLLRDGDNVTGLPSDVFFGSIAGRFNTNSEGKLAFGAFLSGNTTSSGNTAIIVEGDSGFEAVARRGNQAAGLESGVTYSSINSNSLATNDTLDVAFYSSLGNTASNANWAIFSDASGTMQAIVREGRQAAGFADGTLFTSATQGSIKLNDLGQVAFYANVSGGDSGIFITDLAGELQLIVGTGQLFDVNDDPLIDDLREISSIGSNFAFNNLGEAFFELSFTDGTRGVFASVIPAPGATGLLAAAALLCVPRPRRR